jgi:DtxR family Mn-dependent transcriptional regulator
MTPSKEDYILALYRLGGETGLVSNKSIAESLRITPASVTEMLLKLGKEGMIENTPYKGSCLTQEGVSRCLGLLRGHRLWEVFLINHLGYSWSEAHEDADLLEHSATPRMIDRLDSFLGHPQFCPHGESIPRSGDNVKEPALKLLDCLAPGDKAQVRRVSEEKELLDHLQDIGLSIGSEIEVLSKAPCEGPLNVSLDGRKAQLSVKAASKIYVHVS